MGHACQLGCGIGYSFISYSMTISLTSFDNDAGHATVVIYKIS